jgi:hypothetical protein
VHLKQSAAVSGIASVVLSLLIAAPSHAASEGRLKVNDRSLYVGDDATFTGQLGPREKSQKYVLQVRGEGNWRKATTSGYSKRDGRFVVKADLDYAASTYTFRVFGKARPVLGIPATVTPAVKVTLSDRPGSREAPWRPGQPLELTDWRAILAATDTDAWPEIQATQSEEDAPPPGWTYITVPMTFTRTGPGSGNAWVDLTLDFVGSDGVVYSSFTTVNDVEYSCYLPSDWIRAPELYAGSTATATDCMLVPQAAVAGGLWRMSGDYEDPDQFVMIS